MKKLFVFAILTVIFCSSAFAQSSEYKAFKVDLGTLYAIPAGDGVKAGIGFYLEPKYNITDQIAVGLRMEWAIMAAVKEDGMDASVSAVGSYLATGDYYFNTNKVRPFAGLGLGIYNLGTAESTYIDSDGSSFESKLDYGSKFGFAPRAGLLLGHFRMALEYNVITGMEEGWESKNYMSIKLGFEIGGGKK